MTVIFSWVATAIALAGTVLNCKKMKACFYLWTVTNLMWFMFDLYNGLISRAVLDAVQFVLALWGIYEWGKKDEDAGPDKDM